MYGSRFPHHEKDERFPVRSGTSDGLGEQVEQSAVRVVGLLQHLVLRPPVEGADLLLGVELGGVEGLAPAEFGLLQLDRAIVEAVTLARRQGSGRPEADV